MKYTKDQIEALKPLAKKWVDDINKNLEDNLDYCYGSCSKEEYKDYERAVKSYIKKNTVKDMLGYIVEWGEVNEVPFENIEDEFDIDEGCFDFPESPCY